MNIDRRDFLKAGAVAAAMQPARILGANERVRVAVIGLRGRGLDHIKTFKGIPGVEIAAVCDIDENVIATRLGDFQNSVCPNPRPTATSANCSRISPSTRSRSPRLITGTR